MAENNKKPIIALSHKAEVLSYYESIKECIQINGFPASSVYKAFKSRRPYRCMMFIPESEYRNHWECGTTHLLQFKTLKERNKEKGNLVNRLRVTNGSEEGRRKKISETMKAKHTNGQPWNFEKARPKLMKPIRCVETGITYPSMNEAARQLGVTQAWVCQAVRNRWKIHGHTFCLAQDSIIEIKNHTPT